MKHSYQPTPGNIGECRICKRAPIDHSLKAQCESCTNIGDCELIDDILMCVQCQARDKQVKSEVGISDGSAKQNRVTELINLLSKEIPVDARHFHVNEVTQIVDIETKLRDAGAENVDYALANAVMDRIERFKNAFSEAKNLLIEIKTNLVTDQKFLNDLVPKLREEERKSFKDYDITYNPQVIKPTAIKTRQSASDKAIESMAKMMGITVEQARMVQRKALETVMGHKCTCAETPGTCKIHVKG